MDPKHIYTKYTIDYDAIKQIYISLSDDTCRRENALQPPDPEAYDGNQVVKWEDCAWSPRQDV